MNKIFFAPKKLQVNVSFFSQISKTEIEFDRSVILDFCSNFEILRERVRGLERGSVCVRERARERGLCCLTYDTQSALFKFSLESVVMVDRFSPSPVFFRESKENEKITPGKNHYRH